MKRNYYKKACALTLAGILAVSGMGTPSLSADAAGEILYYGSTAATTRGSSMENGMSYTAAEMNTTFNGTKVFSASAADVGLFRDNIKGAGSINLSITFTPSVVSNFMNLLEISNSSKNTSTSSPSEELGVILGSNGRVFLMTGAANGGTDWQVDSGVKVTNGNTYTLTLNIAPDKLSVQMNGGAVKTVSAEGTRNTKKFVQAFFGGTGTSYTDWRQNIDSVVIGGLRTGSCQTHTNFTNFNGTISQVTIAGQNSAETPVGGGVTSAMFAADSLDNTWLFGGGVETQGRFEEIGGVRNFIGQFEEYVRWSKRVNGVREGMQRYTINMGKAGQDASEFARKLPELITKADPMAVAYLIGPEDYNGEGGTGAFQAALSTILDQVLAMKNGTGCAVIQYPHAVKDAAVNAKIEEYIAAAQEVIQGKAASVKERIAVVDHYTETSNDNFKNNMLTEEGLLNAQGHYEISRQFSKVVYGTVDNTFPTISENWTAEKAPDTYLKLMPEVTASGDSLEVTVDGVEGTEWNYILTIDGARITGKASGNPFTIEKLPEGKDYELTVQTGDGKIQLSAVTGTVAEGNKAQTPVLTELQQAIWEKAENKEEALTWLFMGDSITHAAAHTHGYDGIAQIFEKYVKEDLGRVDDMVVNTAVSGATAERTIANIEQRMTKYHPDIVSIMLGTNDTISQAAYNNNLKSIVERIKAVNPDALIIFRSPTPAKGGNYANKLKGESGSVASMKAVAEEIGDILFIDQYTEWNEEATAYPYLFTSNYYYGDNNIHPGAAGQLRMAQQFIRECGLDTNTRIANLSYRFGCSDTSSQGKPEVSVSESGDGITVSRSSVQSVYGTEETIGDMTVRVTDRDGRTYVKNSGIDGEEVAMSLPTSRNYAVEVTANIKGNTAKHVTFTGDDILLTTGTEKEDLDAELERQAGILKNAAVYTTESAEAFRAAYDAAQKAATDGVTDAEQLARVREALEKASRGLTEKKVIGGVQTVTITGDTVAVPENALYTASKLSWNGDKTSAAFTLTAKKDVRFGADIQVAVSNAAELKISGITVNKAAGSVTVTFTVSKEGKTEEPKPEAPKKGQICEEGNYSYKVTDTEKRTVEVVGVKNQKLTKLTVYHTVTLGGQSYKVTSVKASAFKNNKKITSAVIGKNVENIGKSAFAGCTKLKKVTMQGNGLKTLGGKVFSGCKALKNISIKSKSLKQVGKNAFKGIHKKAVIKVPKAKYKAYEKLLAKKGQSRTVKIKK